MAKQRSNKSTYPSRYGGGHVTIAQYITEFLCENIARSKGQELPTQFWEQEEWAKFFRTQIVLLNKQLLKSYHPRAVVKALKDFRCKRVNSFGGFVKVNAWKNVLKEMHDKCVVEDLITSSLKEHVAVDATKDKPKIQHGTKSVFSKLRELENGKERESGS